MTGLLGGLWGVLFPDEDEDEDEDEDGGWRNRLAKNELGPEPGGPLFLKSAVFGVLWRGLEK